jgi:hypothetical protein
VLCYLNCTARRVVGLLGIQEPMLICSLENIGWNGKAPPTPQEYLRIWMLSCNVDYCTEGRIKRGCVIIRKHYPTK